MATAEQSLVAPGRLPAREKPYSLENVWQHTLHGCRCDLVFDFHDSFLQIHVDEDDCLDVHFVPERFNLTSEQHTGGMTFQDVSAAELWSDWIGKECGWTWCAWNSQGYFDCFILSFGGMAPNVLLNAVASSIEVFRLQPLEQSQLT